MLTDDLYKSKNECCGCGACAAICSKNAIEMKADEYGFVYPVINNDMCVNCGLCAKVCSFKNAKTTPPSDAYAAICTEDAIKSNSSSGGIFAGIASKFLNDGGFICGAVINTRDDNFVIEHILSNTDEDFEKMKGSKYVQSDISKVFVEVREQLRLGNKVLVCGTPCQVSAVKEFTKNPENLYTIDLICHGVPSVQMFNDFLKALGKTFGGKVRSFLFRGKRKNSKFCAEIQVQTKIKTFNTTISEGFLSYYNYFLKSYIYRENCYTCPYAKDHRCGDISIGDYWGIEQEHKNEVDAGLIDISKNWSCILVNSEKGKDLIDKYGENLVLIPSAVEKIANYNKQLICPSEKSSLRELILSKYKANGYNAVEKHFRETRSGSSLRFKYQLFKRLLKK